MRARLVLVLALAGALGCTASAPGSVDKAEPVTPTPPAVEPTPGPTPEPDAVASTITVEMTAATLADDCGSGPSTPPRASRSKADVSHGKSAAKEKAKRRCEQSSIQLAIAAPMDAAPAELAVRSVELLLESGASVDTLEARAPSMWSEEGYTPWDQRIEPGRDLSVSYAVTEPDWSTVTDRWNQTFTVKAVISIGGSDRTVQQSVTVDAPTSLPPGVKT